MRLSLFCTAVLTVPILAVVGCSNQHAADKPTKGIVSEKEYKPAKTKKTCKKNRKTGRSTCTTKTVRKECYELDITLDGTGKEIEICDRAAFNALGEGDRYSSATNYGTLGDPT